MKHITYIAIAILSCIALANSEIIYNTRDVVIEASSGGSGCSHQNTYTQRVAVAQRIMFSFPTTSLNADNVESIKLNLKPTACFRPSDIYVGIYSVDPSFQLSETNCSMFTTFNSLGQFRVNSDCSIAAADVTDYVKQALQAGNDQVAFSISAGIDDGVDFNSCQRQDDGSLGCGLEYNSRDFEQSSFYLDVTFSGSSAPTTASPSTSAAPTTAAPSTSTAPTSAPSTSSAPTSPSCLAENVSGPNVASPARRLRTTPCSGNGSCQDNRCVCKDGFTGIECENAVTTTTTTTSAPGTDISGENNARVANNANTIMMSSFFILVLFVLFINF